MASLALGAAILVACYLAHNYRCYARNLAAAKTSGLPIVILPCNAYSVLWLATHQIWLGLLRTLPASWTGGLWFRLLDPEWAYRFGYKIFVEAGGDVFLTVSPGRIHCFVADAEVMSQITARRNDFPKPLEMYTALDIYGKNVVSTEGATWRVHRKLTAPSFGDKNNELVFTESLHHAQSVLKLWTGPNGKGNQTVVNVATDTMRLALYIISRAGFGVRVVWPHEQTKKREETPSVNDALLGATPPPGHQMSYREALSELLENIMWTQIAPSKYLKRSPFASHRKVAQAVDEWGDYMSELYEAKKADVESGQSSEGMDLFGSLIKGSGILGSPSISKKEFDFQKSDLLGNAFVIMLAGHETTANALHYSLIFLAMWPSSQKRLQEDLDNVLRGKPAEEWTYEDDFPRLWDGMAAAVMNETLRLLQPIINIPKSTAPDRPQPVTMGGQTAVIPGGTHVYLSCAVHRNPKYWPCYPSDQSGNATNDVNRFRPERWLVESRQNPESTEKASSSDEEDFGGPSGADTSSKLFRPVKGSYIPFSEGARSCMGRRFAQVELLTVIAVIFREYSVELAVDEYASDADVEELPKGGKARKELWQKAADRADSLLKEKMGSIITLQLRGDQVPLRFVRKGEERFRFD